MKDMQLDLIEHHWHLPTFFSLFGPQTFAKLLTAVLLERSIVFVHQNYTVLSSVILSFKALLRPFMWCHSLIPVLPRPLLDHILQPLPVIVGISQDDYDQVLKTTTQQERRFKTWIFLDWQLSQLMEEEPSTMPFETKDKQDVDPSSGVRIVWGTMDQEFSQEWRTQILLGWLDDMMVKATPLFDKFEQAARSEELGAESILPQVLCSFDMQFEQAKA